MHTSQYVQHKIYIYIKNSLVLYIAERKLHSKKKANEHSVMCKTQNYIQPCDR